MLAYLGFIDVFKPDCPFFTITVFIVMLIVMWDPTGKNTTDVLRLTRHYFILTACLVQKPDNGLVH